MQGIVTTFLWVEPFFRKPCTLGFVATGEVVRVQVRSLKVLIATVVVLISGGAAWAISNSAATSPTAPVVAISAVNSTTSSVGSTHAAAGDKSKTVTTDNDRTSAPVKAERRPTVAPTRNCKPGHGYGDTNHCHSSPPGQDTRKPSAV